ncbi:DUF6477 family protein [Pseudooceanicola sp.]|uniref:DUF6477 family protein n=1 Tax=Pseudooceanicola sp. TaxID=1914328 RepID=UPI0035C6FE02
MTRVSRLRRPRLLVEAAQVAQEHYDRGRDLTRLLGQVPNPGAAIVRLMDIETALNATRRRDSYRAAAHVAVLGALMAEARTLGARTGV